MKKCKSLVAAALAVAVGLGSLVSINSANITASAATTQAFENLISNGSFENETLDGWVIDENNTDRAVVFTDQANSGKKSLKMATEKADGTDSTVKQTILVKQNTNYEFSYYVYSQGAKWCNNGSGNKPSQMKYSVMTNGDSPTTVSTGTFQATSSTSEKFTLVTLTFNSGENTSLDIVFDLANNGTYDSSSGFSFFCIDDVSVTETGNLILNGSFNEGNFVGQNWDKSVGYFGPWKIHHEVANDTTVGHADDGETDTNSITIREYGETTSAAMNYISQQFYVKQNTSYKLTFWAKSSTVDVPYKAIISNQGETSATNPAIPTARITYKTRAISEKDTWEQFELEFNSGDNTVLYLYITGAYKDDSLKAKTNIDDVSIVEYTVSGTENSNLITEGDFEGIVRETVNNVTQIGAWKTGFQHGANVVTDEYHTGIKALKLVHQNSKSNDFYVYQQIKVKKNTGYQLKFWFKSNETLACEVVTEHGFTYPYAEKASILAHKVVGKLNDSDPKWTEVTLNFNSGDNETLYVQFDANALDNSVNDKDNYAYIDDVSVVGYKNGDVDMNGDINATDLTALRKIILGIEIDDFNANVNNDEYIDIRDLVALKKLLCNIKTDN